MRQQLFAPAAAVVVIAGLLLGGCAEPSPSPSRDARAPSPSSTASASPPPAVAASVGTAAVAKSASVAVHAAPSGPVTTTFKNPQPSGAPLTFLVVDTHDDWLKVQLPQRPNGSTGWISATSVSQHALVYSLRVSTAKKTLALYENESLVKEFSVATGTGGTPTPHGSFYLTELLAPTNHGYGPYAFGLSAFSDVLSSFGGGPGQIGLHGTDDADSIGRAASHGCIRMTNADITTLAKLLPLGTPITIE
ncbi:MAG TPA: L,D-transpeptidase family protein [Microbacteriaceae bacterium]|jgi:Uncharacterized protein conserved in bacteria